MTTTRVPWGDGATETMQRRKFIIGMGALASGTAAAVGSGAFTSVDAERDISVEVVDDGDAFLAVESTQKHDDYVDDENGTIELDFTDSNEGGIGISDRAKWVFDNLLTIENQGTKDLALGIEFKDDSGETVGEPGQVGVGGPILRGEPNGLVDGGDNYDYDPGEGGEYLSPGDSVETGVFFNLDGEEDFGDVVEDLETMVIAAEAVDND